MKTIADAAVHICGAGALGSNLACNLARMGMHKLCVIDRDRVEEHNIGTQIYSLDDVGALKSDMLRNEIFRDVGVEIRVHAEDMSARNINKLLRGATLVVDAFDNTAARQLVTDWCREHKVECLHAGVNDEYGEVRWNDNYRVPSDAGVDVYDYPLGRNLIVLVVAVASEALLRYICTGQKENFSITAGDLRINREYD
jgi:molybdopterin/thiamine biosynthesis adenylyltransferase